MDGAKRLPTSGIGQRRNGGPNSDRGKFGGMQKSGLIPDKEDLGGGWMRMATAANVSCCLLLLLRSARYVQCHSVETIG